MHLIVWEFRAAPGREADFEKAYGPDGDWARFFRHDPEYRGTDLLRNLADPGRYVTMDRWTSVAAYDAFAARTRAEYASIDERLAALCADEIRLGAFTHPVPTLKDA